MSVAGQVRQMKRERSCMARWWERSFSAVSNADEQGLLVVESISGQGKGFLFSCTARMWRSSVACLRNVSWQP